MRREKRTLNVSLRWTGVIVLAVVTLMLGGCDANVGVGVSVGVPIGDNGYLSVGSGRWF